MNSKERVLKAFSREEVDYVPCLLSFYAGKSPNAEGYKWKNGIERIKIEKKIGVDSLVGTGIGISLHPDVKTKVWVEQIKGESYPFIHKEYYTPAGTLSAVVKKTEDWPASLGDDIPVISDFNVSRYVKPLIETKEDVEKLPYLFYFDEKNMGKWEKEFNKAKAIAKEEEVVFSGSAWNVWYGMDGAIWLAGPERSIYMAVEEPEIYAKMLKIIHDTVMKTMKYVLERGVDVVDRRGWYESTDFWSPDLYKKFAFNNLKEEIDLAHSYNTKFTYIMCTGIMPLLPILKELDFDVFWEIEPVLGNQDLKLIVKELGDKKSFVTGVSAPIHIEMGDENKVRKAVRDAFDIFGHKGFILNAVPSIRPHWPWKNTLVMVDEWKKLRRKMQ